MASSSIVRQTAPITRIPGRTGATISTPWKIVGWRTHWCFSIPIQAWLQSILATSTPFALSAGHDYTVRAELNGSSLKLYVNGATLFDYVVFPQLHLNGTFLAVWLAHTGFGLPLAVYLLRNYIGSLPSSIIESAKIDGADHFTIFWRLIVPLSVPALAAFAIFQFLWVWNDLLVAYVFLGGERSVQVLTLNLANLVGSRGENWQLLTSAAFISMALPLIVFFSLQKYFVRGLTAGAVKG